MTFFDRSKTQSMGNVFDKTSRRWVHIFRHGDRRNVGTWGPWGSSWGPSPHHGDRDDVGTVGTWGRSPRYPCLKMWRHPQNHIKLIRFSNKSDFPISQPKTNQPSQPKTTQNGGSTSSDMGTVGIIVGTVWFLFVSLFKFTSCTLILGYF